MENKLLKDLNEAQLCAVEEYEGPSLIVAGAGSGKTKVITCRIAFMLEQGIPAYNMMALTFTNKAAKEMKERIANLISADSVRYLWMGTFHSVFAKILRREAEYLGFPSDFTIYDRTDSKNAVKACIRELELDEKIYVPGDVLSRISKAKSDLVYPQAYANSAILTQEDAAMRRPRLAEVYQLYAKKCRLAGSMDFDDILLFTYSLFNAFPEVLERYATRFKYILVDEYQDTNKVQYAIIKALSSNHRNIAVVGDDSQSIYAFRGARIENILRFKDDYPEAKEYRLEQNYRSTQTVVNAANSLISHNLKRLPKECFSRAAMGEKIDILSACSEQEEAYAVVASILTKIYRDKASYGDFAVLYRTNAQSRLLEEALRRRNIPYKVYGGFSFYERAEVKDMLAYMRLLVNPRDDEAFKRVVNVPARGIGPTTVQRLIALASAQDVSIMEVLRSADFENSTITGAAAKRLKAFSDMLLEIASEAKEKNAYEIATELGLRTGYIQSLREDKSLEGLAKIQNVEELINSVQNYCTSASKVLETEVSDPYEENSDSYDQESGTNAEASEAENYTAIPDASLERFLANVALISQLDETSGDDKERVSLMTVHTAKGLEYTYVYVVGMEEQLFPSSMSLENPSEIEEERRLFYVAMTRAKKALCLSFAHQRFRWGKTVSNPPSRFLKEIDSKYLNAKEQSSQPSFSGYSGRRSDSSSPAYRRVNPVSADTSSGSAGNYRPSGSAGNYRSSGSAVSSSRPDTSSSRPASLNPLNRPAYTPSSDFVADDPRSLREGMNIEHERFGLGRILKIEGELPNAKAIVEFKTGGCKTLLLKFAKVKIC